MLQQAGFSSLISDKVDSNPKLNRREKEVHFTLLKRRIQQEEITIINIYGHQTNASQYQESNASQHNN